MTLYQYDLIRVLIGGLVLAGVIVWEECRT
jgi:hypothetical protein